MKMAVYNAKPNRHLRSLTSINDLGLFARFSNNGKANINRAVGGGLLKHFRDLHR
jgi:hypothetical protein